LNDAARALMGAMKRWLNQRIPTATSGTSSAYTLSYTVAPGALADGMMHRVLFNADNTLSTGETTLNVNSLGAKNLRKFSGGSWVALAAGDLKANSVHDLSYHSADSTYRIVGSSLAVSDLAQVGTANTFTAANDFTGGRVKVPTRTTGDSGTDAASTAFVTAMFRSYLAGLGTSNNSGTPNSKIDVAAGVCMDDTNAQMLSLAATTLDCGTTGANGLDTGSLANSTWYHLFVISKTDGTTALLASTSISSPAYPIGYTLKRRIGSFKTDGSAHILAYVQDGDYFRWAATVLDINTTDPGTSAVTATLSVPRGVHVLWFGNVVLNISVTPSSVYVSDLAANDEAPILRDSPVAPGNQVVNNQSGYDMSSQILVRTNTSAQIRYRLSASASDIKIGLVTLGWIDRRGRDS
jgi:hypothetical protein